MSEKAPDNDPTLREWLLQAPEVVVFEFVTVVLPVTFMGFMSLLIALAARGTFALVLWGGLWGVVSLWRVFFSFFRPVPAPLWSIGGLIAGSMSGLYWLLQGPLFLSLVSLPAVGVAVHWGWLHWVRSTYVKNEVGAARNG